MSNETIPIVPLPEGMTRMESGPVQFGTEDWPGYFLRGDDAQRLIEGRETVLALLASGDTRASTLFWAESCLSRIPDMSRCIEGATNE